MYKPKEFLLTWLLLMVFFPIGAQTIKIAVAGNMRAVIHEILAGYLIQNPTAKIEFILGASGGLTQQIINGAAFDMFVSADKAYPDKLKSLGLTAGEVKTYAFGRLVIWSNTFDVSKGVEVLTHKSITRIAIANPGISPYGSRVLEMLKYYGIYDKVKPKLVYADNVAQCTQFAHSGNAQVAIMAQALVFSSGLKGNFIYPHRKSYKTVEQACVILKNGNKEKALKFMEYMLSDNCKPIFLKYGFE